MACADKERARLLKRAEHKRYYGKTAFLYERRLWSEEEDRLVLEHKIPDSQLVPIIERSMKAICNRRWRLKRQMKNKCQKK